MYIYPRPMAAQRAIPRAHHDIALDAARYHQPREFTRNENAPSCLDSVSLLSFARRWLGQPNTCVACGIKLADVSPPSDDAKRRPRSAASLEGIHLWAWTTLYVLYMAMQCTG